MINKFVPYEEAIKRNLKEYYEEKNRLLESLLYFDTYDWLTFEPDSSEFGEKLYMKKINKI